jgi:hypothetical protein
LTVDDGMQDVARSVVHARMNELLGLDDHAVMPAPSARLDVGKRLLERPIGTLVDIESAAVDLP